MKLGNLCLRGITAVALLLVASACTTLPSIPLTQDRQQSLSLAEPADFTVTTINDQPFTLSNQRGKVLVIYLTSFCEA